MNKGKLIQNKRDGITRHLHFTGALETQSGNVLQLRKAID